MEVGTAPPPESTLTLQFQISSAADRGGYVVTVDGELDMCRVPELEHALDVAGRVNAARVLLDLERVTFIDGRAVRALSKATRRFARESVVFQITPAGGQVARMLRITGAGGTLPLHHPSQERLLPRPFGVDFLAGTRALRRAGAGAGAG